MEVDVEWLLKKPIAHRGLHSGDSECPENSLKAFEMAMVRCFPIELDIHLLRDNQVCVFHDPNTQRMTGVDRLIEDLSAVEIKHMHLLGSDQRIPLLDEVLSLIHGTVPLFIEIKSTAEVGELEGAVFHLLSRYKGRYALLSFNPNSLNWFRENLQSIPRGQLAGGFKDKNMSMLKSFLMKNLLLNRISKPHFVGYDVRYLPSLPVKLLRNRGTPIIGWTVSSLDELSRVKPFCDNIVFEGFRPEELDSV